MKYRVLDDRLLVCLVREEYSPGGIALPETDRTKPRRAVVLAVGPGKLSPTGPVGSRVAMQVKPGDLIHFLQYDGVERSILDAQGEAQRNWRIITEGDIRVVEIGHDAAEMVAKLLGEAELLQAPPLPR